VQNTPTATDHSVMVQEMFFFLEDGGAVPSPQLQVGPLKSS